MNNVMSKNNGLSLIELLIGMVITSITFLSLAQVFEATLRYQKLGNETIEQQSDRTLNLRSFEKKLNQAIDLYVTSDLNTVNNCCSGFKGYILSQYDSNLYFNQKVVSTLSVFNIPLPTSTSSDMNFNANGIYFIPGSSLSYGRLVFVDSDDGQLDINKYSMVFDDIIRFRILNTEYEVDSLGDKHATRTTFEITRRSYLKPENELKINYCPKDIKGCEEQEQSFKDIVDTIAIEFLNNNIRYSTAMIGEACLKINTTKLGAVHKFFHKLYPERLHGPIFYFPLIVNK